MGTLRDLSIVVKSLKRRGATAKFCPCCGSPRLKLAGGFDFWLSPGKHVCLDCGYRGFVVMEKDEEEGSEKGESAEAEKEGF
jgi:hypothetical protein